MIGWGDFREIGDTAHFTALGETYQEEIGRERPVNTVAASSKLTPCLARFDAAFWASHSNSASMCAEPISRAERAIGAKRRRESGTREPRQPIRCVPLSRATAEGAAGEDAMPRGGGTGNAAQHIHPDDAYEGEGAGSRGARRVGNEGQKPDKAPYRLLATAANPPSRSGVGERAASPRSARHVRCRAHGRSPFRARCNERDVRIRSDARAVARRRSAAQRLPAMNVTHHCTCRCKRCAALRAAARAVATRCASKPGGCEAPARFSLLRCA